MTLEPPQPHQVTEQASDAGDVESGGSALLTGGSLRDQSLGEIDGLFDDSHVLHAGPKEKRKRGKQPVDDWEVTRAPDPEFYKARVGQNPNRDSIDLKLGATHEHKYFVTNEPPKGFTFSWKHSAQRATVIHGAESNTGSEATARYFVNRPGRAEITTTLLQKGPKSKKADTIKGPVTEVTVARPTTVIDRMYSKSDRGSVPVLDTMQVGEELHAFVHLDGLDPDLTSATAKFSNTGLKVQRTAGLGGGRFQVVLKPDRAGKVLGQLIVMPGASASGEVTGDVLKLNIEKMKNADDFGSRPKDTADALDRVESAWAQVFRDRNTAVDTMLGQEKEQDPPPAQPMWKRFLLGAVKIALNAATAGIGARVADALGDVLKLGEGLKEFVKVMTEGPLNAVIEASGGPAELDKPDADAAGSYGGVKLSLANKFHKVQHLSLSKAEKDTVDVYMTSTKSRAERLDRETEGKGYLEVIALERSIKATAGEKAHDEQYRNSFENWCALLAKNKLGATAHTPKDKDDPESVEAAEKASGTDLSKVVNADRITDDKIHTSDGEHDQIYTEKAPGLEKVAGIIRITLQRDKRYAKVDPEYTWPLTIKHARLEGLKNDALMKTVEQSPIKNLDMPVVASFNDDSDSGFVVGRNEATPREYWASSDNSDTLAKRYPKLSPQDAAKRLLEDELGKQYVTGARRG